MNFRYRIAAMTGGAALVALAGACNPDLNVTNPNAPDVARASSSPGDVRNLIGNSYNTIYYAMQGPGSEPVPGVALGVMGDNITMAYGNFGARFNGQEPRLAYNNSSAAGDGRVASTPYDLIYGALGSANDGLKAIKNGVKVAVSATAADETPQMQAFAYLVQGMALSWEGLVFDRGFIQDENSTGTATLSPYKDVLAAALPKFDKAIAAAAGKTWQVSPEFTTSAMTLTADRLGRMANTLAARTMVLGARTAAENAATNWTKVLAYAEKGISTGTPFNLQIEGDGGTKWYDHMKYYVNSESWIRVDQRVIQLLDPTQPVVYTSTTPPPKATSADARLATDFNYVPDIPYDPARGVYFFSQWQHIRYYQHSFEGDNELTGTMPYVLAAENDLMIAEALVRTNGDKARAAALINKTRVGRGNLPALTGASSTNDLLAAIFYERDVELLNSGAGQGWMDRRRIDVSLTYGTIPIGNTWGFRGGSGLQKGTPRHLPLPAKELETLGMPVYTYGGNAPNPIFPEM
jgi:hypothetical protein